MDINATVVPFKKDVRAKEAANLDKDILPFESILGPIDTAQPIFGANGIIQGITISVDQR